MILFSCQEDTHRKDRAMASIFDNTFTTFAAYIYTLSILSIITAIMSEDVSVVAFTLIMHMVAIRVIIVKLRPYF